MSGNFKGLERFLYIYTLEWLIFFLTFLFLRVGSYEMVFLFSQMGPRISILSETGSFRDNLALPYLIPPEECYIPSFTPKHQGLHLSEYHLFPKFLGHLSFILKLCFHLFHILYVLFRFFWHFSKALVAYNCSFNFIFPND